MIIMYDTYCRTFNSVAKLMKSQDELSKYSFDVKADDPVCILTSSVSYLISSLFKSSCN